MLDERKMAILSAIVQEYVATAQPVGSAHVAARPDVGVSSATVRNEMAVLEAEGFVTQPHTSSGRVPTDKGYRFFVDHLARPGRVDAVTAQRIGDFFDTAHGRLEELLHRTTDLLAHVTRNAAVVLGPTPQSVDVRSVQLVRLGTAAAAVVVVLANGSVINDVIDVRDDVDDEQLEATAAYLSSQLEGRSVEAIGAIGPSGDATVDRIVGAVVKQVSVGVETERVFVGGTSSVAEAFDAVEVVREVLHTLDQQFVVVSLVRDILGRGMSVAIGGEHGVEPLAACSVVVAPIVIEGEHLGSVGVLGPTRMNYPRALATVDVVSERLGQHLGDHG